MPHSRSAILTLVAALIASWLSLACGHCYAMAQDMAQDLGDQCHHSMPDKPKANCCDHQHKGPVCPEGQLGAVPTTDMFVLAASVNPDIPAFLPADDRPWLPWRSPPPVLSPSPLTAYSPPPLYLRHCAFLK